MRCGAVFGARESRAGAKTNAETLSTIDLWNHPAVLGGVEDRFDEGPSENTLTDIFYIYK